MLRNMAQIWLQFKIGTQKKKKKKKNQTSEIGDQRKLFLK